MHACAVHSTWELQFASFQRVRMSSILARASVFDGLIQVEGGQGQPSDLLTRSVHSPVREQARASYSAFWYAIRREWQSSLSVVVVDDVVLVVVEVVGGAVLVGG